jgi:type II secretory pathway predicted ATPase ExeA
MKSMASDIDPLLASPLPEFFYVTDSLNATLQKIEYVVENRQGLTVVYGDVGTGKSSLMQTLFDQYQARDEMTPIFIPTPKYSTDVALLRAICAEMGLPRRRSMLDQEHELRAYLVAEFEAGRNVVLLIDEAQIIPGRVLELIRLLLNLDTRRGKLMQIVLAGQIELRDRLRDPSKKALRSRIFITSTLDPLTLEETKGMIEFRFKIAGRPNPFPDDVIEDVWTKAKGIPREIVKRCAMAAKLSRGTVSKEAVAFVHADVEAV